MLTVANVIKGFFFDLDGTLVDTHESNYRAYRQAVEHIHGVQLGDDLKQRIKAGESSVDFLPKLIPEVTDEQVKEINKKKKEVYPDHLHTSSLNEYLTIFLQQMSQDYTTVLVTTAKKENALAVLRAHDIEDRFTFMIFGNDVSSMKPNPEAYQLALKKANLAADEVIAFEDSQKGIDAALAAGIQTVRIGNFL